MADTLDIVLETILEAAKNHGDAGEPDMEVGDLQQLARDLWSLLTPAQKGTFLSTGKVIDWADFILNWPPKEST